MNHDETWVLQDRSIVVFLDDGTTKLYPSELWKKPKNKQYHQFIFDDIEQAKRVFTKIIEKENWIALTATQIPSEPDWPNLNFNSRPQPS